MRARIAAAKDTPTVNGLDEPLNAPNNPNLTQPFRLDRSQFETTDQDHGYTHEQQADDAGLVDSYVERVGRGSPPYDYGHGPGLVMGYYDGNTVTALWNYAQTFAMSDNSYGTNFGPSSVGAINLVSGQTHGFSIGADEFIAGTGAHVAEQIIAQCRAVGCGHFLSTMSRNRGRDNQMASYEIYAREVIPRLRRAAID